MSVGALSARVRSKVSVPQHRLYKVSADACNLRVGDHVIEETTVGEDFSTGLPVQAGCRGMVTAVDWSADEHALFVWVQIDQTFSGL